MSAAKSIILNKQQLLNKMHSRETDNFNEKSKDIMSKLKMALRDKFSRKQQLKGRRSTLALGVALSSENQSASDSSPSL